MGSDFSIRVQGGDGRLHFVLRGELDLASAPQVQEALPAEPMWDGIGIVVIDMRELEFLDSSGLRSLFLVDETATEHGARAIYVRGPEAVQRVFEVTALDQRLEIVDDPAALPSNDRVP